MHKNEGIDLRIRCAGGRQGLQDGEAHDPPLPGVLDEDGISFPDINGSVDHLDSFLFGVGGQH